MSRISASQIDTYDDGCNRFWWFQRILKLSEPPATHFTFGTVLHSCNERYLSADSTQRVPPPSREESAGYGVWATGPLASQQAGRPVNLYPKGWETVTERDGSKATITPTEAKLIKKLVQESIENGVLRWREGTDVEREVLLSVIEDVQLIGYIDAFKSANDVQLLPLIEDHKSYGKGSLRYLKNEKPTSPNYLGKNQQLKTYCWAISMLDGWEGDVTVRHNQYPKFPGKEVTAVETTITRETIVKHGEYLRDVAERMERTRKIKKWEDVPGPKDTGKCSRWYGKPCPFSDICGHAETPDAYKARLERLIAGSPAARLNLPLAKPKNRKAKEATVSIFDRATKQKAARSARKEAAGTTEARAAVPEVPVNGATPEPEAVIESGGAPWSNPGCKACKGRGLTSKNKACPICDNTAKRGGRPTSMSYIVEITDEGTGIAVARAENVDELEAAGLPLDWEEGEVVLAPVSPAAAPAAVEAPTPAPEPEAAPAAAEAAPVAKKRKRRTKAEIAADKAAKAAAESASADIEQESASADIEPEVPELPAPVEAAAPKARTRKPGAGRPRVGLTIMVGATYLRGLASSREVVSSAEVLTRFGAELAEDMGAESYWALDTWKRRERLAEKADYIVSALAGSVIVHPGELGNDDIGTLVRSLSGVAEGIDAVIGRIG
jgi:hypothetical protein